MSTIAPLTAPPQTRRGLLRDLDRRRDAFAHIGPNWFATVMGTGIVAIAAVTLPLQFPGLRVAATVVWVLASTLLVAVSTAFALHWLRHPGTARGHAGHPVMAHFYGAPPMALLTVGTGTLLLGRDLLGAAVAVPVAGVLWALGTVTGLVGAVVVPFLVVTRHETGPESIFGGWLMPVVPPMVSAAGGAVLLPYLPAGQPRLTMLLACYAMFGLSLLASVVVTTLITYRLTLHGPGPARPGPAAGVPTLFILVGWPGQSVTAVNLLGADAHLALPPPYSTGFEVFGLVYGLPVLGFGLLWTVFAAALALRVAPPFSLTWWSFVFPVGTMVTGTSALALHTGAVALDVLAVALYVGLLAAWLTVAARTTRGVLTGRLLRAPA